MTVDGFDVRLQSRRVYCGFGETLKNLAAVNGRLDYSHYAARIPLSLFLFVNRLAYWLRRFSRRQQAVQHILEVAALLQTIRMEGNLQTLGTIRSAIIYLCFFRFRPTQQTIPSELCTWASCPSTRRHASDTRSTLLSLLRFEGGVNTVSGDFFREDRRKGVGREGRRRRHSLRHNHASSCRHANYWRRERGSDWRRPWRFIGWPQICSGRNNWRSDWHSMWPRY